MITRTGLDDQVWDDSGIVIKTQQGIIVISGCAHSGICNTIEHAKEVTNESKVLAVMGNVIKFIFKKLYVNDFTG
ncbi:MAG: hypothetical protein LUF02_08555, partial [Erysipelotrichaceae bacterium]|nr:hypothetical protein [Erysipelotrichaceae bacterium]